MHRPMKNFDWVPRPRLCVGVQTVSRNHPHTRLWGCHPVRRRSGMTIMEVMFAIMITTIGLLGAVSVFPVASEMARKGRLNDEVTICADTAVHKFDAQGMRRPDRWVRYVYNSSTGFYSLFNGAVPGESYCIDPRMYAQNLVPNTNMAPNNVPSPIPSDPLVTIFPTFPHQVIPNAIVYPNGVSPPRMARLTMWNNSFFSPMGRFQSDFTFSFEDQLAYERPGVQKGAIARNDNALPAFQLYSPIATANGILPGKREDDGKLSWMATLVPKIDQFTGSPDDKYVLSTVIFYGRSPSLTYNSAGPYNEWTAVILGKSIANQNISDFHGNGFGGGEVTITANSADMLRMRAGDWVMLAGYIRGPIDGGSMATPKPYTVRKMFKWYRITDADEDPYPNGNVYQRDVTLVGPDWDPANVLPVYIESTTGNVVSDAVPDNFVDDVEVFIVPNVVAVFDRTVRLEMDAP